jgi:hypothetical protein
VSEIHPPSLCRMATKAVFAVTCMNSHLDIRVPGSDATVHVWWLNVTLIMGAMFGFAEHSLCIAWASTFRGARAIELSHYDGSNYQRMHSAVDADWAAREAQAMHSIADAVEPLLASPGEADPLEVASGVRSGALREEEALPASRRAGAVRPQPIAR